MSDLIPEGQQENQRIWVFEVWPEVPESEGEYSSFDDIDYVEANFESLRSLESGYPSLIDDLEPFLDEDYLESLDSLESGNASLIDDSEPFLPDPFLPDDPLD